MRCQAVDFETLFVVLLYYATRKRNYETKLNGKNPVGGAYKFGHS